MQTADSKPSKKELKQFVFNVNELKRLVWDLNGCEDLSL